ncbi:hypothetical protein B296_00049274, partial [Ensete ventricosum]
FTKDNLPMAFGGSISTVHVYEGIVYWRNAKNIIDTLIQMQVAEVSSITHPFSIIKVIKEH